MQWSRAQTRKPGSLTVSPSHFLSAFLSKFNSLSLYPLPLSFLSLSPSLSLFPSISLPPPSSHFLHLKCSKWCLAHGKYYVSADPIGWAPLGKAKGKKSEL